MNKLKFKKLHPDAVIPSYATEGSAGLDLVAVEISEAMEFTEYNTGLAVEIPKGYVGLLIPRSSVSAFDMMLKNSVGVIDSDYRGPIKARFQRVQSPHPADLHYMPGDRVVQLVILPLPRFEVEEAEELSDTERGKGGFGSTGK